MEQHGFDTYQFILINGNTQYFRSKYLHSGFLGGHTAAKDLRGETNAFFTKEHLNLPSSVTIIYYYGKYKDLTQSFEGPSTAEQEVRFREFKAGFQAVMTRAHAFMAQLDTCSEVERQYFESLIKMIASDTRCRQIVLSGFTVNECLEFRNLNGLSFNETSKFKVADFPRTFTTTSEILHRRVVSELLFHPLPEFLQQGNHTRGGSFPEITAHRPPRLMPPEPFMALPMSLPTSMPTSASITSPPSGLISPADPSAGIRNPVYRVNRRVNAQINAQSTIPPLAPRGPPIGSSSRIQRDQLNRRLDPILDPVPVNMVDIMEGMRLCNKYHLKRFCSFVKCKHRHRIMDTPSSPPRELNEVELRALRILARRSPCRFGTSCNDSTCFAGHWCTNHVSKNGRECSFPDDMHFERADMVGVVRR